MSKTIKKYELQLLAVFGAVSGVFLLLALLSSFNEVQNLFSALDNLSSGF